MMRIALDIGHGIGNRSPGVYDPGAVAQGFHEHNIVAGMAKRLKADLERLGHDVLLTQGLLGSRGDTAKRWGAHFLLSLHCNSDGGSGVEAWVDSMASQRAKTIAQALVRGVGSAAGLKQRGVKVKNFTVLKANPHDVLLELFFIDSAHDLKAYQANVDAVELAILNALLSGHGLATVATLPRKWDAQGRYYEVRIHTSEPEVASYRALAAANSDAIVVKPTEKDSWKEWK